MAKSSGVTKRLEVWSTTKGSIIKSAVRHSNGKFHGATNFRVKTYATPVSGTPVA